MYNFQEGLIKYFESPIKSYSRRRIKTQKGNSRLKITIFSLISFFHYNPSGIGNNNEGGGRLYVEHLSCRPVFFLHINQCLPSQNLPI